MKIKYTMFGQTKMVEAKIILNEKRVDNKGVTKWDEVLWVERGEDEYALMSSDWKNKRILVVDRNDWLRGELVN